MIFTRRGKKLFTWSSPTHDAVTELVPNDLNLMLRKAKTELRRAAADLRRISSKAAIPVEDTGLTMRQRANVRRHHSLALEREANALCRLEAIKRVIRKLDGTE